MDSGDGVHALYGRVKECEMSGARPRPGPAPLPGPYTARSLAPMKADRFATATLITVFTSGPGHIPDHCRAEKAALFSSARTSTVNNTCTCTYMCGRGVTDCSIDALRYHYCFRFPLISGAGRPAHLSDTGECTTGHNRNIN